MSGSVKLFYITKMYFNPDILFCPRIKNQLLKPFGDNVSGPVMQNGYSGL